MGKHTSRGSAGKTSGSDIPGEVIVGAGAPKLHMHKFSKRAYTIAAVVAAVIVLIVAVTLFATRHRLPSNISSVCTGKITTEANKYHNIGESNLLTQLTYTIKTKKNYQNDPNCMYIIAEQQLLSGDVNSAKHTIDELEKTYGAKYKFDSKLDNGKASIANLHSQLELMQNVEENSKGRFDPDI